MVNYFKRFLAEAETAEAPTPQLRSLILKKEFIGTTGTEIYSGYSSEEYLQTLANSRARAEVFDKMRRGDAQIEMCLNAVNSPIKSANWEIQPYDLDDAQAVADAELIEHMLMHDMDKTWQEFLDEALTFIPFGHAVFEMVDKAVLGHKLFGSYNGIQSLSWRSPKTIERWNVEKPTGLLKSITQVANGDLGVYVNIPAEFLLVISRKREGSNYEGVSALRPCYGNWFRKNHYLKLNAIGVEKFAIPTPLVKVPNGAESNEQYDKMTAALESYAAHEKGWLTYPEGWEVNLNTNTYDPQKVEMSIDNEDKRMVKAFMANFLELGMNGFGSQSLSFDLSDFFLGAIEQVAQTICDGINRVVIPRYIQLNRGSRDGYPKLCVSGITDKAGKELAEIIKSFSDGRIIIPDDELEKHVRKRYGLPEMMAEGKREPLSVKPPDQIQEDVEPKVENDSQVDDEVNPKLAERIRKMIDG